MSFYRSGLSMASTQSYGSLSGSFRLTDREHGVIQYLRLRKRMNVQHIASLLGRSLSTVHSALENVRHLEHVDNRGQTKRIFGIRRLQFDMSRTQFRLGLKLLFKGMVQSIPEAFDLTVIRKIVTENSGDEDAEDPA